MVDLILMHLTIHGAMKKDRLLDLVPGSELIINNLVETGKLLQSGKKVLLSPYLILNL